MDTIMFISLATAILFNCIAKGYGRIFRGLEKSFQGSVMYKL